MRYLDLSRKDISLSGSKVLLARPQDRLAIVQLSWVPVFERFHNRELAHCEADLEIECVALVSRMEMLGTSCDFDWRYTVVEG